MGCSATLNARFVHFLSVNTMKLFLTSAKNGMPTAEILARLVSENKRVSAIFTFTYKHPALLQQRLALTPDENAILAKASALREASKLPFWEALLLSCFGERRGYARLLREAPFHQSHNDSVLRVSRDEVLAGRLAELANSQPTGHHLSFSSRIELGGVRIRQLPLLDFHCPATTENDQLVSEVCKQLFQHTTLVFSSGESYHALGLDPLDEEQFTDFLTTSLLFAPIVDTRYIAHQMLEGACALRLSSSVEKPIQPRLKFILRMDKGKC